jgi:hypothetical protein
MTDAAVIRPWLRDRRIAHLLALWRAARPAADREAGRLPSRAAIDPLQLGSDTLPYVALIECTHGGERFRFRLVGSKLVEHAGLDLTGSYIDDLNPNRDYAEYINGLYRLARDSRRPVYSETRYRAPSGRVGLTRRLICPLADDGLTVDRFVGAQVFETDDREGDAPTYTFAASFLPGIARPLDDTD